MIWGALVVVLVLLLVLRRGRRRRRRDDSSTVLADLLDVCKPYKGPRWRVGDRWL